jgi:hypothetical protein
MKKIKSYPWTKQEEDWLRQSIKDHPEWSNATMYNQMKYALPYTEHTKKATASKINTLRPSRGKCKWNAKAHTTLAQQFVYGLDHESMADYFNVSVPAIGHQLHKLEKMGMIKRTPGRQVTAHERVIKPLPKCIEQTKQLNIDFNQEVANQNKLAANIFAIDKSVEALMSKPRTATEMRTTLAEQDHLWSGTTQELIVHNIVNILGKVLKLLEA